MKNNKKIKFIFIIRKMINFFCLIFKKYPWSIKVEGVGENECN